MDEDRQLLESLLDCFATIGKMPGIDKTLTPEEAADLLALLWNRDMALLASHEELPIATS